jgi:hypothetical protein
MVYEACGAAPSDAGVGISATPWATRRTAWPSIDALVDLGVQVGGFFPAPSAAFDRYRSGALEDVTGASLRDGEPSVIGAP